MKRQIFALAAALATGAAFAADGVVITEWMYQGRVFEFVEFNNVGTTAVNFSSWSYDDDSRLPACSRCRPSASSPRVSR